MKHLGLKVLLGILGAGAMAHAAMAQASQDQDYNWIINKLRADGISASTIQWSDIDSQCLPLKSENTSEYTHCKLAKARLQADFREDTLSCNDTADAFRPNTLRYHAVVLDEGKTAPQSETTLTLLNTTPAVADAKAFRRHLFNQCMRSFGWRNPRDYRRGQEK